MAERAGTWNSCTIEKLVEGKLNKSCLTFCHIFEDLSNWCAQKTLQNFEKSSNMAKKLGVEQPCSTCNQSNFQLYYLKVLLYVLPANSVAPFILTEFEILKKKQFQIMFCFPSVKYKKSVTVFQNFPPNLPTSISCKTCMHIHKENLKHY